MTILLVQTTSPDQDSADQLAEQLIVQNLAACVKTLGPCRSTYRWQGHIEHAFEIPMLIITDEERYPALEHWLQQVHPYELPEILSVTCSGGLPAYLNWVRDSSGTGT
jgi:periplasmic divalent cation tolerance protein